MAVVLRMEAGRGSMGLVRRVIGWVALLIVPAFYLWLEGGDPERGTVYVTEPVRRGALTVTVIATGTVAPTNKVAVSSELSGVVRKVLVDYNSVVAVGDVLAELEAEHYKNYPQPRRAMNNHRQTPLIKKSNTHSPPIPSQTRCKTACRNSFPPIPPCRTPSHLPTP